MKKTFISFAIMLFCTTGYGQEKNSLSNTTWKVTSIKDQLIPKNTEITIHFGTIKKEKAPVYGNSGCNNFRGQYYITKKEDGSAILGFSQFVSTRKACLSKEVAQIEDSFLQTIPFVQTFFKRQNKLNLQTIDQKIVIVLVPKEQAKE